MFVCWVIAEMERKVSEKREQGIDLIAFSMGDPDLPPPDFVVKRLVKEAQDPVNHNYPASKGQKEYRQAVANWYKNRFNIELDPECEVTAVIGAKEGLANIARAFVNPGDKVLVPKCP